MTGAVRRVLPTKPRRGDWLNRRHELRQVCRDDLPDDVFVNTEVVVDDFVAHADDVRPLNLRMPVGELSGHLPRGFANDLDQMNPCKAKILVSVIRLAREAPSLADRLPCHVEHVPDVDEVTRRHTEVRRCLIPDRESED